jgi:hypothetical protein
MIVWCNVHAGFALGVVVMGLLAAESLLGALSGRAAGRWLPAAARPWLGRARARALPLGTSAGSFLLSFAASGLNPFGYANWLAILGTLGGGITPHLSEWKPIYAYGALRFAPVYLLAAIVVVALVAGRRSIGWFDLLVTLGLGTASVLRVRFVPLFTIAGTMLLLRLLPGIATEIARRRSWARAATGGRGARVAALLAAAVIAGAVWVLEGRHGSRIVMVEELTPVAGVKFLEENGIGGRILNEYDWGGYLVFKLPDSRIFCDGRSDTVYPPRITGQWARFVRGRERWAEVADRYGVQLVVLRRRRPVVELLARSPGWTRAYQDAFTVIFLRDGPENAPHLARLRAGQVRQPSLGAGDYVLP